MSSENTNSMLLYIKHLPNAFMMKSECNNNLAVIISGRRRWLWKPSTSIQTHKAEMKMLLLENRLSCGSQLQTLVRHDEPLTSIKMMKTFWPAGFCLSNNRNQGFRHHSYSYGSRSRCERNRWTVWRLSEYFTDVEIWRKRFSMHVMLRSLTNRAILLL